MPTKNHRNIIIIPIVILIVSIGSFIYYRQNTFSPAIIVDAPEIKTNFLEESTRYTVEQLKYYQNKQSRDIILIVNCDDFQKEAQLYCQNEQKEINDFYNKIKNKQ